MDAIKQAIDLDRLEKLARMVQGEEWQSYRGTSCAPVEASTILRLVRVARAAMRVAQDLEALEGDVTVANEHELRAALAELK
jgi:hypothetical protein